MPAPAVFTRTPTASDRRQDLLLAVVMLVGAVISAALSSISGLYRDEQAPLWWALLVAVGVSAPLIVRRRYPALVAVVIAVPLLTWGVTAASRGSVRGRAAMVGALAHSGRVIFAAGAVMVAVFFTFALSGPLPPKEMGIVLGVAVLLDAFLVRLVLLPVILRLTGRAAWWSPRWLTRVLPTIRFSHD